LPERVGALSLLSLGRNRTKRRPARIEPTKETNVIRSALLVALLAAAGVAQAQSDPNLGRNLAATCANCHGTDGVSVGGNESLAGVPRAELLQKLNDFKTGKKPATIMHQLTKGYTDAQLELVATWFAAQPKPAAK
jgi:cytochrome c553